MGDQHNVVIGVNVFLVHALDESLSSLDAIVTSSIQ